MFKTVIIEDDPFAKEMLNDLLAKHADYRITGTFNSVKESIDKLPTLNPDLVFLDIELPDGKGFNILEQLPKIDFEIIITTQHDSYMLQAIKHSALDYLFKPVKDEELTEAIRRFENKIKEHNDRAGKHASIQNSKLILSMNQEMVFLEIADIIRLESDSAYTIFYTKDKRKYVTSRTLATYVPKLLPYGFFRVHHSHVINLHHVDKYLKGEGGQVIMSDASVVEVSRRKKEDFIKALAM